MLQEINPNYLHSTETDQGLRWFNDARHDLFVWFNEQHDITRFQFCYDKNREPEQAVEWVNNQHLFHQLVDSGENHGGIIKASPIFVANGEWDADHAYLEFVNSHL